MFPINKSLCCLASSAFSLSSFVSGLVFPRTNTSLHFKCLIFTLFVALTIWQPGKLPHFQRIMFRRCRYSSVDSESWRVKQHLNKSFSEALQVIILIWFFPEKHSPYNNSDLLFLFVFFKFTYVTFTFFRVKFHYCICISTLYTNLQ